MTEREYNEAPGVRRSDLWQMKQSPAHFRYRVDHPLKPTPALTFGTAAHCAVLTPELYQEQYWAAIIDGRTKEGKEAKQSAIALGKTLLTPDQADAISGIVEAINANPFAKRLLTGEHESSRFWTDDVTGEACKCRTDCETDIDGTHYIVDLKTCADASTEQFMRDALRFGYHVQAAMYTEGVKAATGKDSVFVFVAVEKEPPYGINILQADPAFILHGTDEYRYLLGLYHECKERDFWPSYGGLDNSINTLGLPAWMKKEVE